ncbi:MAG TPA: acyloxyacyl hydrolase [Gemmatimonadaceae bacterium]|nr:acyloxyacyl hydrolase [Gemmatimonadaceae bacterium]
MRRVLSFAALSLIAIASTASAQRTTRSSTTSANPSPEIGVDAGLQFTLDSPRMTSFQIPIQGIRMGFYVSPEISIEPSFRLNSTSFQGAGSLTTYGVGLGMLYHFSTSRLANQMYVRPFIGLDGVSGGGNSDSAFSFGGGFGVKVPVGSRFASRFEANISHASNNGVSANAIGLLAGLSVYTH